MSTMHLSGIEATRSIDQEPSYNLPSNVKGGLLAQKILNRIKDKGLTRQEFAQLMNVQPSIITRWLTGNHNFTMETLYDIERNLQIQLVDIGISKKKFAIHLHLTVKSSYNSFNPIGLNKALESVSKETFNHKSLPAIIENTQLDENYFLPDQMIKLLKTISTK